MLCNLPRPDDAVIASRYQYLLDPFPVGARVESPAPCDVIYLVGAVAVGN